jgi:hypothetical protein
VLAHLAGLFVGSAPLEHLQHLPGNFGKWFCPEADRPNNLGIGQVRLGGLLIREVSSFAADPKTAGD